MQFKRTTLFTGLGLLLSVPFAHANPLQQHLLQAANTKKGGEYVRTRFLKLMKIPFTNTNKKKILLIGDSHAQDFLNAIRESGYLKQAQLSTRYVPTRCQLFLGDPAITQVNRDTKDQALCAKSDDLSQMATQIAQADVIILAANWRLWAAQQLPNTIKQMALTPKQKLIVIGRKSFGQIKTRQYLRMTATQLKTIRNPVDAHQLKINQTMQKMLPNTVFVNSQQLLCGSEVDCAIFTPEPRLISFDGGHLTPEGAVYAGKRWFSALPLRGL